MTVRELRWADFDDLRETYYLLYEERERGGNHGIHLFRDRPTVADEVGWFSGLFRRNLDGEGIAVVAEREGRVVGHCTIDPSGGVRASERGHVGVLGILVHRDHRGQGIGSALLAAALEKARDVFPLVRLSVFASNEGAVRLYERFGFVHAGRIPGAFRRQGAEIDEILMVRDRRPPRGPPGASARS